MRELEKEDSCEWEGKGGRGGSCEWEEGGRDRG